MRAEYPACLILAIHDDVVVAGPSGSIDAIVARLLELASELCGLTPTGHKFTAFSAPLPPPPAAAALHTVLDRWTPASRLAAGDACRLQSDGLLAGGVPLGSPAFVQAALASKLESQDSAHSELRHLMRDHCKACYLLLRYSLGQRFVYWVRTVPPAQSTLWLRSPP